jgi:DNA-binding FrmR family transcriptional regulator
MARRNLAADWRRLIVGLLDDHLRHCVADAVAEGGSAADERLTEATAAVARLLKS